MTEFETIKTALERIGDTLVITEWKELDEALIKDKTSHVDFWFKGGKLDDVGRDLNDVY